MAQHTWDEVDEPSFVPTEVKPGDIVFVSWHFGRFLVDVAPRIEVPFVLITSNSDQSVRQFEVEMLERTKILTWFAVNVEVAHPRIVPIPLGLENLKNRWYGDTADFRRLTKQERRRSMRLCWGFAVQNNEAERRPALAVLEQLPYADRVTGVDPFTYRRLIGSFAFIASPPGNGPDCHRTWEALYLGLFPVVKRSVMTQSFVARGAPLVLIDDWTELLSWSEGSLLALCETLKPGLGAPMLFFDYWKMLILDLQKTHRPGASV